jgi:hypothetical protein
MSHIYSLPQKMVMTNVTFTYYHHHHAVRLTSGLQPLPKQVLKTTGGGGLCKHFLKSLYCKRTKWYRQLQQKPTCTIIFPLIVTQWSNFPCLLILFTEPILVTLYLVESCSPNSTFEAARGTFEIFTIFNRNVNCHTMKCISVMKKHVIKGAHLTSTCKVTTV